MEKGKMVVNGTYFHIENGGVSFKVTNEEGPTIEITASHFGNITNNIKLHIENEGLKHLADMFREASEHGYNLPYVCAAECVRIDKETGKTIRPSNQEMCSAGTVNEDPKGIESTE